MTARRVLGSAFVLAGVLVCAPSAVEATQVVYVPVEQMAQRADVAFFGQVTRQEVTWDDTRQRILTLTEVKVLTPIKGVATGEHRLIYQVGGRLDGEVQRIPGTQQFQTGEHIVFFGQRFRDMLVSFGIGQGVFRVRQENGTWMVYPAYGNVAFAPPPSARERDEVAPPSTDPKPLGAFVQHLREVLHGDAAPHVPARLEETLPHAQPPRAPEVSP